MLDPPLLIPPFSQDKGLNDNEIASDHDVGQAKNQPISLALDESVFIQNPATNQPVTLIVIRCKNSYCMKMTKYTLTISFQNVNDSIYPGDIPQAGKSGHKKYYGFVSDLNIYSINKYTISL